MSAVKRALEFEMEKDQVAEDILVQAGLARRCDSCGLAIDIDIVGDLTPAYKLANWMVTNADDSVSIFESNRKALTDAIQSTYKQIGEICACGPDGTPFFADD